MLVQKSEGIDSFLRNSNFIVYKVLLPNVSSMVPIYVYVLKGLYQPYKEGILENALIPRSLKVGLWRNLGPEPQHEW